MATVARRPERKRCELGVHERLGARDRQQMADARQAEVVPEADHVDLGRQVGRRLVLPHRAETVARDEQRAGRSPGGSMPTRW